MKFALSFRAKLILAVFPVVAGVTVAALLVAERKFSRAHEELFEQQFESQIETLSKSRERRTETLAKGLEKIAADPEILEHLQKSNPQRARSLARPEVDKLVLELMKKEAQGSGVGMLQALPYVQGLGAGLRGGVGGEHKGERNTFPGMRQDAKDNLPGGFSTRLLPGQQAVLLEFTDAQGNFLHNKGSKDLPLAKSIAPLGSEMDTEAEEEERLVRRRSDHLPWLGDRKLEDILKEPQVAYLITEVTEGKMEQVREFFVTPMRDSQTGEFAGALVVGFPMPALQERRLYETSKQSELGGIMSGVFTEDRLISNTVPENQRERLAERIKLELERNPRPHRELEVDIDGIPHRLIYRVLNPGSPFPQAAQVSFYSLEAVESQVGELRRNVTAFGAAALLVALGAILIISRGFSGPIAQLAKGAAEVGKGNYDVRVPVKSRDEVGRLSESFNQMAAGLALQEKYRNVLNAVADRTVAEALMENRAALGGELREATVLFCDIRGFTALTERMPPGEVIEMLNEHMTALTEVAYQHGGIVDKFVGDLLMVLFGVPVSEGGDAAKAVRCAWDMLEVRHQMNRTSAKPLEVGIGIATGTVVAGCMGSERRLSYTVLGERVNLASRLCSIAQAGEIVIDQNTLDKAPSAFATIPLPPVSLKGFSQPAAAFKVISVQQAEAPASMTGDLAAR